MLNSLRIPDGATRPQQGESIVLNHQDSTSSPRSPFGVLFPPICQMKINSVNRFNMDLFDSISQSITPTACDVSHCGAMGHSNTGEGVLLQTSPCRSCSSQMWNCIDLNERQRSLGGKRVRERVGGRNVSFSRILMLNDHARRCFLWLQHRWVELSSTDSRFKKHLRPTTIF